MLVTSVADGKIVAQFLKQMRDVDEIIETMHELFSIETITTTIPSHIHDDNRVDLTDLDVFTVDPPTTLDCDDAFSVVPIVPDSEYAITVHIADPSLSVDLHQLTQFNTIYGSRKHWSMMPEELAFSILPGQRVPAISFEYRYFPHEQSIRFIQFVFSWIESRNKFAYEEVDVSLSPFSILFAGSQIIAKTFQGALDLKNDTDDSKNMVKFWMQRVNLDVGEYMSTRFSKTVYRIHAPPSVTNPSYGSLCRRLQVLTDDMHVHDDELHRLVQVRYNDVMEHPNVSSLEKSALTFVLTKSQSKACYNNTVTTPSHFALGVEKYLHITSPIRRAADLLNLAILHGICDYDTALFVKQMNEWERKQMEVEAMLEQFRIRDWLNRVGNVNVDAFIVACTPVGVTVFLDDILAPMTIHISKLTSQRLSFDKTHLVWLDATGSRTFGEWDCIQVSTVMLK